MENADISRVIASRQPYKQWLQASLRRLSELGESSYMTETTLDAPSLLKLQVSGLSVAARCGAFVIGERKRSSKWKWNGAVCPVHRI